MTPDWQTNDGSVQLYLGDALTILPQLEEGSVDAVVTDPPYLTGDARVPILGHGVADRRTESTSVGLPWGYSLEWLHECRRIGPTQWIVLAHYKMLGCLCSRLDPSCVFTWRKSNAPCMTRPVPRLDSEFIIWSRTGSCGRMGEFKSMVIDDVPMLQAGCFATERVLKAGTKQALHPCQKPLALIAPFVDRLPSTTYLDPFMGLGTTGVACVQLGRKFIGIEIDSGYFQIAVDRIRAALDGVQPAERRAGQLSLLEQT